MKNGTINAAQTNEIGTAYGRTGRIATAKEMALANVVGSKDGQLMVEKGTLRAWKWADHFSMWATMEGWTGQIKKVRGKFVAVC